MSLIRCWDAHLLSVSFLDRQIDAFPLAFAFKAEIVAKGHHTLSRVKSKLSLECDRDGYLKGTEPSKGHFVAAIFFRRLLVHVVDSEAGMQAEAHLFDHVLWRDLLIRKLYKGGPLVSVDRCKAFV